MKCYSWKTGKALDRAASFWRAVTIGLFVSLCSAAHVQAGTPTDDKGRADSAQLEDILVTARRQTERLQDVPVSVTALNASELSERRIMTESDLQTEVPGLTVRQTTSSNQLNFAVRGQSIDAFSYSSPAVLSYLNEVQVGGVTATAFFDLESIQVLKGPQGTLFGRNATGGAVLYKTKDPDPKFDGYLQVGYGNYNDREIEGAINLPLSSSVALRIAGQIHDRDGFQRNLYNGDMMGSVDSQTLRASLQVKPAGSNLENTTVLQYGQYGGLSTGLKLQNVYSPGQTNNGYTLNSGGASLYPAGILSKITNPRLIQLGFNGLLDYLAKQQNIGFYDVYNDAEGNHDAQQYFTSNTTTYEFNELVNVKNIFGFNKVDSRDKTDVDGSPFDIIVNGYGNPNNWNYIYDTEQGSDEIQLYGKLLNQRLKYIFGLYGSRETDGQTIRECLACDYMAGPAYHFDFQTIDTSKAVFLQTSYELISGLNFTVGGRYTWEDVRIEQRPDDLYRMTQGVTSRSASWSKPSWTVGLDYRVSDSLMLYAVNRGSWRTGGFNGTATEIVDGKVVQDEYKPETTHDFEVGAKFSGNLGPIKSQLNLALFDQYVDDVQRTVYIGIAAVSGNVNKARVSGAELDGQFELTQWLRVGGAFTYADGRYTDPHSNLAGADVIFGPYGDTPKFSGSVYARAATQLSGIGELALRGDVYAQSAFYYTNVNDSLAPGTQIAGYKIVNGRLELNDVADTRISIAAYARNLTGEKYYAGGLGLGPLLGFNSTVPGMPRTYGVEASYKF